MAGGILEWVGARFCWFSVGLGGNAGFVLCVEWWVRLQKARVRLGSEFRVGSEGVSASGLLLEEEVEDLVPWVDFRGELGSLALETRSGVGVLSPGSIWMNSPDFSSPFLPQNPL